MSSEHTFEEASAMVMRYVRDRHWETNSPRSLAISLSLEAGELLEQYQWHDETSASIDQLAGELADILIYAIQYAERLNIDIPASIVRKLEKQAKKYPADLFQAGDDGQRHQAWLSAKRGYRDEDDD